MKDDLTQDELTRLYEIIHAGRLPGLYKASGGHFGELYFLTPKWGCAIGSGVGPSNEALAIIALETSLAEVARERGLWLQHDHPIKDAYVYFFRGSVATGSIFGKSPVRLTALVRCAIAAFEGVEL